MSVSLTTLRALVRERADMVGSAFVADTATGLDAWINEGYQRLHGLLVEAMGDEYVESQATLTTVAGTSDYALPATFFKLYGIDLPVGGSTRTLRPFTRGERNSLTAVNPSWLTVPRYRVTGSNLRLLPAPQSVMVGTIFYAPVCPTLTAGSDSVSVPNGWELYIVLYAAIQALLKEESDVRGLREELSKLEANIIKLRDDRDQAFPHQAVDVDAVNLDWRW